MRLLTYLDGDTELLGWVDRDLAVPTGQVAPGLPRTMDELLAGGPGALEALHAAGLALASAVQEAGVPVDRLNLLAPVPRPSKIIAVGLNYLAHAAESKETSPAEPLLFAKLPSAVIGHRADITWDPGVVRQVDAEAELAVVIGRRTRGVRPEEAFDHVLGYTACNDVSARDLQAADGQWVRAKSLDTFCPLGPVLVTADDVPDPQDLKIQCILNGTVTQSASTRDMHFPVGHLVSYCSAYFTLEPGDIIATGTPPGVGIYRDPPILLSDGDEVAIEIERIGRLVNTCRFRLTAGMVEHAERCLG
jgi:2-keto-4-pentenoate hydratase/2-oxohepta-3-ene-1,7-dioic acid hydratase in catechol pathway